MRKASDDSWHERALESKVDARRGLLVQHRAFSCLISTLQTLRNTRRLASRLKHSNSLRLQQRAVRTWAGGVQMLSAQRCRVLRMQQWRARRECLGIMHRWSTPPAHMAHDPDKFWIAQAYSALCDLGHNLKDQFHRYCPCCDSDDDDANGYV